jgi:hypothetical protein
VTCEIASDVVATETERKCGGPCGRVLPLTLAYFYRRGPGKFQSWCIECQCRRPRERSHRPVEAPPPKIAPQDVGGFQTIGDLRISDAHAAIITASGWATIERMKAKVAG